MRLNGVMVCAAAVFSLAGLASPVLASPVNESRVISVDDGDRYEIVITGEEVEARVNGLRLAPDRVVRRDREIALLDDQGQTMKVITLGPSGEDGVLWVGADGKGVGIERPPVMLGVLLESPGEALRSHLGVGEHAVLIEKVIEGLPASKAGLKRWDIIIEAAGRPLDGPGVFHEILMGSEPGETLELVVIREGGEKDVAIELAAYDNGALGQTDPMLRGHDGVPGLAPLAPQAFGWSGETGVNEAQRALVEAMRALTERGVPGGDLDRARQEIERAMQQLRHDPMRALRWRLDDQGRLLATPRPEGQEEASDSTLENRLEAIERELASRLSEFEARWGKVEETFERMMDRLEQALERQPGENN